MNIQSTSSFGYTGRSNWNSSSSSSWDSGRCSWSDQGSRSGREAGHRTEAPQDSVQLNFLERGAQGAGLGALHGSGSAAATGAVILGLGAVVSVAMGQGLPTNLLGKLGRVALTGGAMAGASGGLAQAAGATNSQASSMSRFVGVSAGLGAALSIVL